MEVLGIDIGGSGIKGAPVDTDRGIFMVEERFRIPTPEPSTPENVVETVAAIASHFEWKGPIGCGFPAPLKNDTTTMIANLDQSWAGKNVAEKIIKLTGCPTHVVNDVDAAGLAEMTFGVGVGHKGTVMMVSLGTGIGTAIFTDGVLYPNSEFGHIILKNGEESEKYASSAVRKSEDLSWEEWAMRVNELLAYLDELLWPDMYIIGGGVVKYHEEFLPLLESKAEILPAKLLNHAGIIGSALSYKYAEDHIKMMKHNS